MGRKLKEREGAVLGLSSSRDLYEKLKHDSTRLTVSWGAYEAFDFIVTAWHLYNDWGHHDPKGEPSRAKRTGKKLPEPMVKVLKIVRDIANGSKHVKLDLQPAKSRVVEEVHDGQPDDFWEWFHTERKYGVSVGDGEYFSIRVLHNIVMSYFQWVFDNRKPVTEFPFEILECIDYCNVSERDGRPAPPLWEK